MKIFDESICTKTRVRNKTRCGTAAVEMTLVLPFFMLFMGTIIAFGFNATWKLRTEIVSRDVTWRNRRPHSGSYNSNRSVVNAEWTTARPDKFDDGSGRQEVVFANDGSDANLSVFDDDEVLNRPIIRGPIPQVNVNSNLLNFSRTVDQGVARIHRQPTIMPLTGAIDFYTEHSVVSDLFRYGEMGIWNESRRIPIIYEIELDFIEELPAYQQAFSACQSARDPECLALDQEEEHYFYFGRYQDNHPRARRFASLDKDYVEVEIVEPLLRRIESVPQSVARKYIRILTQKMAAATGAERQALQARIDALRDYIQSLDNGDN